MKTHKLEIACFNLESAFIAENAGADRVELCDGMALGGVTPAYSDIEQAKQKLKIELMIMIRPRGGNFVYSDEEFLIMKRDIQFCRDLNVSGFVFGILKEDNSLDEKRNRELVDLASPFPCSFHRAFDAVPDALNALEKVIDCGFKTILTSGQKNRAIEGVELLSVLAERAGSRIVIMPGGGVRSSNIAALKEKINTSYYHSSAVKQSETADAEEIKLLKQKIA